MNMQAMPRPSIPPAWTKVESICYLLRVAQHRLLDETRPKAIRMSSYVRLCCISIRAIQQMENEASVSLRSKMPYLSLLTVLHAYKYEWWNECSVNDRGEIVCEDSIIQELLQPLNQFVAQYLDSTAPL